MTDNSFKKQNRPAICLSDPVLAIVPKNQYHATLNIVKQAYRDRGEVYDAGCPKRHTCFGSCSGRPVASFVSELQPYINKLSHLIKDDKIYVTSCAQCSIVKTCKSTCNQINDYMNRNTNMDDMTEKLIQEPNYYETSVTSWVGDDDTESNTGILPELIGRYGSIQNVVEHLPWGSINDKRQRLVRMYMFEGKDFRACASELGYSTGLVARNEFFRSLTTLSKCATIRYFMESNRDNIPDIEYELLRLRYYEFLTVTDISKRLGIPFGSVCSRLSRFIKRNKLKYSNYVNGNKVTSSNIF